MLTPSWVSTATVEPVFLSTFVCVAPVLYSSTIISSIVASAGLADDDCVENNNDDDDYVMMIS